MSIIIGDIITIGRKSGGGDIYALIDATYPVGSTCIATNGTVTLTATDTSGQVVFGIPEPASTPETWTVSCTDGTNSDSTTVSISTYGQIEEVTLVYIPSLNDASWALISEIAQAGTGDTYWDIGDCKAITLNGKIAKMTVKATLYVFILDFNHPINKTVADNNIIFGGFKTALTNGKDVALTLAYGNYNGASGTSFQFINGNINHGGGCNYGGWKGCDLRYDILGGTSTAPYQYNSTMTTSRVGYNATESTINSPVANTLMAILPSDFRAVLRLWNRYVDFKGNSSNTNANCSTPTVDAISLLAEYEIFGSRTRANNYEKNHQKQMAYYSAGNSKIKYQDDSTETVCDWWTSSAYFSDKFSFCCVSSSSSGSSQYKSTGYSIGIAPAFKV